MCSFPSATGKERAPLHDARAPAQDAHVSGDDAMIGAFNEASAAREAAKVRARGSGIF